MSGLDLPARPSSIAHAVEGFFATHQRPLPWRQDRTAYRVWLSEIMCQQTRVQVATDYFLRFVERFPTVHDLARAPLDDVLAMWSGLGYYARGRNLHRAARMVSEELAGAFPDDQAGLRALPGVGAYTAAAVASFAFGKRCAVVDGNVMRVLARLCADGAPLDEPTTKARMTERARVLVQAADDGPAFSEGLMELGALVCTPKATRCDRCPLSTVCAARRDDNVALFPVKKKKRARQHVEVCAVVVHHGDAVWLERRADRGLFGGLYEVPAKVVDDGRSAARVARDLLEARGLPPPATLRRRAKVERTLTHRELAFYVYAAQTDRPHASLVDGPDLHKVGLSTAMREVLRAGWPKAATFLG